MSVHPVAEKIEIAEVRGRPHSNSWVAYSLNSNKIILAVNVRNAPWAVPQPTP